MTADGMYKSLLLVLLWRTDSKLSSSFTRVTHQQEIIHLPITSICHTHACHMPYLHRHLHLLQRQCLHLPPKTNITPKLNKSKQYDDLSAPIAIGAVPVGTYKDLIYDSWVIRPDNASVLGGFGPHSPPNTILTSAFTQAMNGTPSFIVAPPYTSARFESFYFACNVQTRENVVCIHESGTALHCKDGT